jgi:hypothetical protein
MVFQGKWPNHSPATKASEMVSLPLLEKLGCSVKTLRAAFSTEKPTDKVKKWKERMGARIQESIDSNVADWRLWHAIDSALDSPMYFKSRTFFQGLFQSGAVDTKNVLSMVKELGINDWLKTSCGCGNSCSTAKTCPSPYQTIDIPAFFEITFPFALAFKNIRAARIFNDRNLFPQFKYEPLVSTPDARVKCEIITYRTQVQSQQMEYKAVLKQVIHQTLSYSHCLLLPRESWWFDAQPIDEKDSKGKYKMRTVKEGIRYEHPHPSRMYYDMAHPAYTLNSGTGCQYSGYWGLVRYGDVQGNDAYWNTDKITFGEDSFRITDTNKIFFATVMPCQMKFPSVATSVAGEVNREERMRAYTTDDQDTAVLLTNHFERLNPMRDLGLKNSKGEGYDGEVWFRFVVASDDTVVYAEPLAYNPNLVCLYDPDANKARVTSLVQECIPAQDMVSNLISQAILTAKNNLRQINFVNTDVIDASVLDKLENIGEKSYRVPVCVPFSRHESRVVDQDKTEAIIPVPFPRQSIAELINLVDKVLDILARGLVMSAQELGATDSHEVTAQEVLQKASSTSTRLNYTASGVDDFIYNWQRQIYDAGMAYWDDEIFAEVALQNAQDEKALEKLGFKVETRNEDEQKVGVRGNKQKLELDMFTARRDAADRVNSVAMATAMTNFFQGFINNPMAIEVIGVEQFVQMVNGILDSFQFKKDWRLTAKVDVFKKAEAQRDEEMKAAQQQQSSQVVEQLKAILPQIQQQILGEVGMQLKPVLEQAAQLDATQEQKIQGLEQATLQIAEQTKRIEAVQPQVSQMPPQMPMMAPGAPPMGMM